MEFLLGKKAVRGSVQLTLPLNQRGMYLPGVPHRTQRLGGNITYLLRQPPTHDPSQLLPPPKRRRSPNNRRTHNSNRPHHPR